MIHLDGRLLAERLADIPEMDLGQAALKIVSDLNVTVPRAVVAMAEQVPRSIAKAEANGDHIVEDTAGRLVAEVLGATPADIGQNPPELKFCWNATLDELRAKQRRRLHVLIKQHEDKERRKRRSPVHTQ